MFGPVIIKPHEIEKMRRACRLAADTLEMIGAHIRPGITTEEINVLVHEYTLKNNARPAPLNYGGSKNRKGFPKSVCTSVNDVVCHGIPNSNEVLKDGTSLMLMLHLCCLPRMGTMVIRVRHSMWALQV